MRDLGVTFRTGRGLFGGGHVVRAVDGVSLALAEGRTLALVGESGSGKSTIGRAILRLVDPDAGTVELRGRDLTRLSGAALRRARREVQMVFQDPYSSLDPILPVGRSIGEPLEVHTRLGRRARERRVAELLELVGLRADQADRLPHEFSGGQRQRLAIARALAVTPKVVVCDEAVSALDVSTQNQVIDLLERLQRELGVSYLFISHDLSVVRHVAHDVAVLYLGKLVEQGPVERVFAATAHPYTQALLAAVPQPRPGAGARRRVLLRGDLAVDAPEQGCALHPRCPHAMDVCRTTAPEPVEVPGGGSVSCHLHTTGPALGGRPLAELSAAPVPAAPVGAAPAPT
ncbi:MAG: ABC transporter ATP-binding protein [Acidimicrobiia bacterium]